MSSRNLILATAGHVDHGKTALIKALTGIDTDRLPEEKARGITIDLGFAQLALPGFSLGVIDVPGHEDFVRNMIAGLGAIDLALLVVAADDGWMPQSEEHLQILDYLGVQRGVVAITKCDLGEGERVAKQVGEQLQGTSLGECPIVLTSIKKSLGLPELKETLAQECAKIPAAREIGKPRLFVDRAFSIRGSGTIVTGTLSGGQLARGDSVAIQPHDLRARIRTLQSHNQALESVAPAARVAVNLPDLAVEDIPRGSLLTTVASAQTSRVIDVLLMHSGRLPLTSRPLKTGSFVHFHYGSARLTARLRLLDSGGRLIARLVFPEPLFAFVGDRFILRDTSARHTLAGGVILDPDASERKFRSDAQRAFLEARAASPNELRTLIRTQLARDGTARKETLLLKSNFSRAEIAEAVEELARVRELFCGDEVVADASWWQSLGARAQSAIAAQHTARPQSAGLELRDLRVTLQLDDEHVFDALVAHLCANGFERAGGAIRRRDFRPSLPPQLQRAGAALRAALAAQPFDPPSRKQLLPDASSRDALRFLSETGEVISLGDEVILSATAFAQMKTQVQKSLAARGAATTGELRQALGTSRRVLIPLLEQLDRAGLTLRQGDRRLLRAKPASR